MAGDFVVCAGLACFCSVWAEDFSLKDFSLEDGVVGGLLGCWEGAGGEYGAE